MLLVLRCPFLRQLREGNLCESLKDRRLSESLISIQLWFRKKKLILSHTQENVDIMTGRLTWDIFITKDAIWDDMFPLLLILSKCELGAWNKFISWTFLYLETFLLRRTLFKTVRCCFHQVRLCLELILSHEKKLCKSEIYTGILMTHLKNRSCLPKPGQNSFSNED